MNAIRRKARAQKARALATAIAHELFTNFNGDKAERLVLENPNCGLPHLGGWCPEAVIRLIERRLLAFVDQ